MIRPTLRISFAALLLAPACGKGSRSGSNPEWAPEKLTSVNGVPATEIESAIKSRLAGPRAAQIQPDQWVHTRHIYKLYGGNALWLTSNGLHKTRPRALMDAILTAETDAIRIDAYPLGELARAVAAVKDNPHPTAQQLADADVILTAAYATLGENLLTGQVNPKSVSQNWHIDPEEENVDSALVRGLRIDALDKSLATMRPADSDYVGLVRALAQYRALAAKGGWPASPGGKGVTPGRTDNPVRLKALRARLASEGMIAPRNSTAAQYPALFDIGLAATLAQWQARHGLAVDSMLDAPTMAALNLPATYRMGQIAANLERMRWLPRSLGSRYIFVNVPEFKLEAHDTGTVTLEMKVIVGKDYEDKATPVFSDSMETVVFRPYWLVTPDIAAKEIFPKGPAYLEAENMETYPENGQTRVRQRPGPKNALGLVKFLFPNDFNIYLHDTPNHELFKNDIRAFSHGCVRVEKPDELASWVLGWPIDQVQAQEHSQDDHSVKLPKKIPVYIAYFTTYMNNGQLWFGNDLYDRDDALVAATWKAAAPNAGTTAAIQALRRIAGSK
jgi:murein L,D-transpeptidase YcbB/YkuD